MLPTRSMSGAYIKRGRPGTCKAVGDSGGHVADRVVADQPQPEDGGRREPLTGRGRLAASIAVALAGDRDTVGLGALSGVPVKRDVCAEGLLQCGTVVSVEDIERSRVALPGVKVTNGNADGCVCTGDPQMQVSAAEFGH